MFDNATELCHIIVQYIIPVIDSWVHWTCRKTRSKWKSLWCLWVLYHWHSSETRKSLPMWSHKYSKKQKHSSLFPTMGLLSWKILQLRRLMPYGTSGFWFHLLKTTSSFTKQTHNNMQDLWLPQQCCWRIKSFGMLCCVVGLQFLAFQRITVPSTSRSCSPRNVAVSDLSVHIYRQGHWSRWKSYEGVWSVEWEHGALTAVLDRRLSFI